MIAVVLGATGGVGRQLVGQALAQGDRVRVVLRDPARLPFTDGVEVIRLDLGRSAPSDRSVELARAIDGADVVLSALGSRQRADRGVLTTAADRVVTAMRSVGAVRYIGVSAAPVGTVPSPQRPRPPRHDPGDDLVARALLMPLVKRLFGATYADAAAMEDLIRSSGLDWTIVRPPRLTDGPATGSYRVAIDRNVRGGRQASRADVAALMLRSVGDASTIGHTLGVAR